MNLIHDPWIPIKRRSGELDSIAPWQLTEKDNPPVELATPRPDFNGALIQFLIGLMQTARPPTDEDELETLLHKPPSPDQLRESLEPLAPAFNLTGDGPLFMQEQGLEGNTKPISCLLIDTPGHKTLEDNCDHFVHRATVEGICEPCAAAALFTLQLNAPSGGGGGGGHMTSIRGGGPLTTLVMPDDGERIRSYYLWLTVCRNLFPLSLVGIQPPSPYSSRTLPWIEPELFTKEAIERKVTSEDVDYCHLYWAMPRRVLLSEPRASGTCDLCGDSAPIIAHYSTLAKGIQYNSLGWNHPLSPYYSSIDGNRLPVHLQADGVSYQHWLRAASGSEKYHRAKIVDIVGEASLGDETLRLWMFGYDMESMKPRCWYETTYPLFHVPKDMTDTFSMRVERLVDLAVKVSQLLEKYVKLAWFKRLKDARGDYGFLKQSFFSRTESAFFHTVEKMLELIRAERQDDQLALNERWFAQLRQTALGMFDYWANRGDFATADPRRIVEAKQGIVRQLTILAPTTIGDE